jgi:hypothetical protein
VNETVILPEMLEAGVEALTECRKRKLGDLDVAIAVYLAMRAIEEIATMRAESRSVH